MKKILLSLGTIVVVSGLVTGGTGAFLWDTETSTGNTFATGVIDLKIGNESYVTSTTTGKLVKSPTTSWAPSGLDGKLFFNFDDLKPGDIGEDTISIKVNNNPAWACMSVEITGTPENGQNEPELLDDTSFGPNEGELQEGLYFIFWNDDGDNVYEVGENVLKEGLADEIFDGSSWTLADSKANNCGDTGPLPGNAVKYIGKVWCFGDIEAAPVKQDGKGKTASNGPLNRGTGFNCDGEGTGNEYQSDGMEVTVSFTAVQSRGNEKFTCGNVSPGPDPSPKPDPKPHPKPNPVPWPQWPGWPSWPKFPSW